MGGEVHVLEIRCDWKGWWGRAVSAGKESKNEGNCFTSTSSSTANVRLNCPNNGQWWTYSGQDSSSTPSTFQKEHCNPMQSHYRLTRVICTLQCPVTFLGATKRFRNDHLSHFFQGKKTSFCNEVPVKITSWFEGIFLNQCDLSHFLSKFLSQSTFLPISSQVWLN